jgi:3-deoxy-manno-octulosonate cytidylyltransferase (CMP-KDO synthetase)
MQNIIGIIPSRYGSTRLPGKSLISILGKSLLQRTYESARRSPLLSRLIIATDDQRIFDHAQAFGAEVVMTSIDCQNGTERIAEVVSKDPLLQKADVIINIQGDEPCIEAAVINAVATALLADPEAVMSTAAYRLKSMADLLDPSIPKCVFDKHHRALYFSRSPIPYSNHHQQLLSPVPYYGHLGIYAFRPDFLLRYASMPPTHLQQIEDLEQLKVVENGYPIKIAIVDSVGPGVNTPEDIKKVEQYLCIQNTSSLQEA